MEKLRPCTGRGVNMAVTFVLGFMKSNIFMMILWLVL